MVPEGGACGANVQCKPPDFSPQLPLVASDYSCDLFSPGPWPGIPALSSSPAACGGMQHGLGPYPKYPLPFAPPSAVCSST